MPSVELVWRIMLAAASMLWLSGTIAAQAATGQSDRTLLITEAPREPMPLWRSLRVLQNLTGADLSPTQAAAAISAGGTDVMTPIRPEHSLGRRPTPVWATFSIKHSGRQALDLVLAQRYPTIESLELYRLQDSHWMRILGTHETARAMFERDRFPNFKLALEPGERATYLVKMQTVAPLRWVLSVQEPGEFATEQRRHDWALAFGYTVPLSVLLLVWASPSFPDGLLSPLSLAQSQLG